MASTVPQFDQRTRQLPHRPHERPGLDQAPEVTLFFFEKLFAQVLPARLDRRPQRGHEIGDQITLKVGQHGECVHAMGVEIQRAMAHLARSSLVHGDLIHRLPHQFLCLVPLRS